MASSKQELKERLGRYREIKLSVTGRKSGRIISRPVWFVMDGNTLFLLPVAGSDTEWYKNVLHHPKIGIAARHAEAEFHATTITEGKEVKDVVEKFQEKYGVADVKKYYAKFDAAVRVNV